MQPSSAARRDCPKFADYFVQKRGQFNFRKVPRDWDLPGEGKVTRVKCRSTSELHKWMPRSDMLRCAGGLFEREQSRWWVCRVLWIADDKFSMTFWRAEYMRFKIHGWHGAVVFPVQAFGGANSHRCCVFFSHGEVHRGGIWVRLRNRIQLRLCVGVLAISEDFAQLLGGGK